MNVFNDDERDYENILEQVLAERMLVPTSSPGKQSIGGWHTKHFALGRGWLGEAMARRIRRAGLEGSGMCWGNILPTGSAYRAHSRRKQQRVCVWCLAGAGALHIEGIGIVPDRPGQLVVFPGAARHWVPTVTSERVTIAANLNQSYEKAKRPGVAEPFQGAKDF